MSFNIFSLPADIQTFCYQLELSDMGRLCLVNKDSQSSPFIKNYILGLELKVKKEIEKFKDKPVVESLSNRFQKLCHKVSAKQTPSMKDLQKLGQRFEWFQNFLFNVKRDMALLKYHEGRSEVKYRDRKGDMKGFVDSFFSTTKGVAYSVVGERLFFHDFASYQMLERVKYAPWATALTGFSHFLYLGNDWGQIFVFEIGHNFQKLEEIKVVGCENSSTRIERMKVEGDKLIVVKSKIEGEVVKWFLDILPADLTQAENSLDDSLKLEFESTPDAADWIPGWTHGAIAEIQSCSKNNLTIKFVTIKNQSKIVTYTYIIDINSRTVQLKDSTDVDFSQNSIIAQTIWVHKGIQCELKFTDSLSKGICRIKDYTPSQKNIWMSIARNVQNWEWENFHKLTLEEKNQIYRALYQHLSATRPYFDFNFERTHRQFNYETSTFVTKEFTEEFKGKWAFNSADFRSDEKAIAIYNCVLTFLTNRECAKVFSWLSSKQNARGLPLQWSEASADERRDALRSVIREDSRAFY